MLQLENLASRKGAMERRVDSSYLQASVIIFIKKCVQYICNAFWEWISIVTVKKTWAKTSKNV